MLTFYESYFFLSSTTERVKNISTKIGTIALSIVGIIILIALVKQSWEYYRGKGGSKTKWAIIGEFFFGLVILLLIGLLNKPDTLKQKTDGIGEKGLDIVVNGVEDFAGDNAN